jgi:hypothetical protein
MVFLTGSSGNAIAVVEVIAGSIPDYTDHPVVPGEASVVSGESMGLQWGVRNIEVARHVREDVGNAFTHGMGSFARGLTSPIV